MNQKVPPQTTITSVDELDALFTTESLEKLILIDCHEDWCGPTTAMVPFYVQLFMDTNEAEKRITLAQLNYSVPDAKEKIKAIVEPVNHDINIGSQGCRPLFLVFRNGACMAAVDGLNTPIIQGFLDAYIPSIKVEEDSK